MALTGNFTVIGPAQAVLPDGCEWQAVTLPAVPDWSVVVPSAYARVESVQGKSTVIAAVTVYSDSTKAKVVARTSVQFTADMSATAANYVRQAYEALKAGAPFNAMTDVFEAGQTD